MEEINKKNKRENFGDSIISIDEKFPQKFMLFETVKGDYFIVTLPRSQANLHRHLVDKALELYKNFYQKGGGELEKDGNMITLFGKSSQFPDIDFKNAQKVLQKEFPEAEVIIRE